MTRQEFLARAADHVLLLDGATGSNLRKAGMPVGISSEEWVLKNPEVLKELQRAYVEARLCMPLLLEQTESVL